MCNMQTCTIHMWALPFPLHEITYASGVLYKHTLFHLLDLLHNIGIYMGGDPEIW